MYKVLEDDRERRAFKFFSVVRRKAEPPKINLDEMAAFSGGAKRGNDRWKIRAQVSDEKCVRDEFEILDVFDPRTH